MATKTKARKTAKTDPIAADAPKDTNLTISDCVFTSNTQAANKHTAAGVIALAGAVSANANAIALNAEALSKAAESLRGSEAMNNGIRINGWN